MQLKNHLIVAAVAQIVFLGNVFAQQGPRVKLVENKVQRECERLLKQVPRGNKHQLSLKECQRLMGQNRPKPADLGNKHPGTIIGQTNERPAQDSDGVPGTIVGR